MNFRTFIFAVLIFSAATCNHPDWDLDYSNSPALAFKLLDICVEKTLDTHAELNTKDYVLDLNEISTLSQEGVDSFLRQKNPLLSATHDDTLMVLQNTDWKKSYLLKNIIVKFIEIEYITKKHITVRVSKMRARNQRIIITLDLERKHNSYKIIKSEVKR
ncbi:MAG: hypothetical protein ABIN36_15205 [Ferruginibacter sp.]